MRSSKFLAMLPALFLCGCQSFQSPAGKMQTTNGTPGNNRKLLVRYNAMAVLDGVLNDEKNVIKILLVKHHSDELGKLIKDISGTAGQGAKMLDEVAKQETGLDLKQLDLPPGEMAVRQANSKTK